VEKSQIIQFLQDIDAELAKHADEGERLDVQLIGRSALILRYGLNLATKDVDMVTPTNTGSLEAKALELFGKGTQQAAASGLYLEPVPMGLPPIPGSYRSRSVELAGHWQVLRPLQPEPHDLAVTKLKRFHAGDREDVRIMCDSGDLTPEGLQRSLDSAHAFSADAEEDPGRKRAYENLRRVIDYLDGRSRSL
jgi:hypothetical protein